LALALVLVLTPAYASVPKYIQEKAVPFTPGHVPSRLLDALYNKRLVLIGEAHGTNEAPAFTLDLVKSLAREGPVTVGLEFPRDLEPQVNKFVQTGDRAILWALPFFRERDQHSGRASQAVIQMLRELKNIRGVKIFCYDLPTTAKAGVKRDTEMARAIYLHMKEHKKPFYVVLSGNIHSRLSKGFPGNSEYPTMGSELLSLSRGKIGLGTVTNIMVRSYEGTAWQCWSQSGSEKPDCGYKILKPFNSLYSASVKHPNYFLFESEMVDGHRMTVFFRKVTASMPEF